LVDSFKLKEILLNKITFAIPSSILFILFFNGCSNKINVPSNIEEAIKTYYDGYHANDSSKISSVLSKDYSSIGYPSKEDERNSAGEINFINMIHTWHSDLSISIKRLNTLPSNNGYRVYVSGVENLKHNETGKIIDIRFLDIWLINKLGKIKSRERYQDTMDYWEDIDYGIAKKIEVSFHVDMSYTDVKKGNSEAAAVYIVSGNHTGPSGVKMIKGENNIWSANVMMPPGKQEYKFRNGYYNDWGIEGWEDGELFKKDNCGFNQWGDREVVVQLLDKQKVGPFCFNSCISCN